MQNKPAVLKLSRCLMILMVLACFQNCFYFKNYSSAEKKTMVKSGCSENDFLPLQKALVYLASICQTFTFSEEQFAHLLYCKQMFFVLQISLSAYTLLYFSSALEHPY